MVYKMRRKLLYLNSNEDLQIVEGKAQGMVVLGSQAVYYEYTNIPVHCQWAI